MTENISIVWFRQDLRIEDNPALYHACKKGLVIPIYIWSPDEEGDWPYGAASRWWLHHSLNRLNDDLEKLNLRLIIRKGKPLDILLDLISTSGVSSVYWSRRYEPYSIKRDAHLKATLHSKGIEAKSFNASLLFEPWDIANKQGRPFQVFTPFWKCCLTHSVLVPIPQPEMKISGLKSKIHTESIDSLQLLPKITWDSGLKESWSPGESSAKKMLNQFIPALSSYVEERDFPSREGTSWLSPYLHFGEISPRTIWHTLAPLKNSEMFLRQLGWREFSYHLLYHFPKTDLHPLRDTFASFPWENNKSLLKAWQKGATGYPIIDAGMRQLWHTGWMHNRVRMIVGSFLVKDLLINWTEGARWFWDTLVDADLANNTMGWQWVAGCGADAAPYFRIFNPTTQSEKFDPDGDYIRRWVPELSKLPNKWIHQPWIAPKEILMGAGVSLGTSYPFPIVDHTEARLRALALIQNRLT